MADERDEKIHQLKMQLESEQSNLRLAAEIGNKLLQENSRLTSSLELANEQATSKIEKLEQDKYSLQLRLDAKERLEQTYTTDMDNLRQLMQQQAETFRSVTETEHHAEVVQLKTEMSLLKQDCEQQRLVERQLRERCDTSDRQLHDTQQRLAERLEGLNETCGEETTQLHAQIHDLQANEISMKSSLQESLDKVEQLQLSVDTLTAKLGVVNAELEQQLCDATSTYNALQISREEVLDLRIELDMMKMESKPKKKGNSLFSELEDRRIEAERELLSMNVKYKSLKKQHETMKQQQHQLKVQLAGLLQMASQRTDKQHMERLLQQLGQAQTELSCLQAQVQHAPKSCEVDPLLEYQASGGKITDSKHIVEFLQVLLKNKERERASLECELQTKRLVVHAESSKVVECERQLYAMHRQFDTVKAQNIRLRLKLDELRLKYEPESVLPEQQQPRKGKLERIIPEAPVAPPASTETNQTTMTAVTQAPLCDSTTSVNKRPRPSVRDVLAMKIARKTKTVTVSVDEEGKGDTVDEVITPGQAEEVGEEGMEEAAVGQRVRGKQSYRNVIHASEATVQDCKVQ